MFETSNTVILSVDNMTNCIHRVFAMAYAMAIQSWLYQWIILMLILSHLIQVW